MSPAASSAPFSVGTRLDQQFIDLQVLPGAAQQCRQVDALIVRCHPFHFGAAALPAPSPVGIVYNAKHPDDTRQ